jgi:cytochrome c oxidase subunit III
VALAHEEHDSLQHQFDSLDQQREASTLGMWVFLVTEIMFFGGLFTAYVVYRNRFGNVFAEASHHLDLLLGAINTGVLIFSSLTMALAIWSAQMNRRKAIVYFLLLTVVLGSTFLGIKAYEYHHKWVDHLVPGANFHYDGPHAENAEIFFSLYFVMTGIHGLHMIAGICVILALLLPSWRGRYDAAYHNPLECLGLYWHFVDIVWIFLFPLLYLLGAHARTL